MHIATISSQRQITLPKRMLEALGLGEKDKLLLEVRKGKLQARPVTGSLTEQLAGSWHDQVKPDKLGVPYEKVMAETKKLVAEKLSHD